MGGTDRVEAFELVDEEFGVGEKVEGGDGKGVGEMERTETGEIFSNVGRGGLREKGGEGGMKGVLRRVEGNTDRCGAGILAAGAVSKETKRGDRGGSWGHIGEGKIFSMKGVRSEADNVAYGTTQPKL